MQPRAAMPGLITTDAAGGITMINEAAGRLLGTGSGPATGRPIKEFLPDSRLTDVLWTDRTGRVEQLTVHGRQLAVSRTPVYEGARLTGSIYVLQDLAEFLQLQNTLRQLQADKGELETILDASLDMILVIDGRGVATRINKAGQSFYGVNTGELTGRSVTELEEQGFSPSSVARLVGEQKKPVTCTQRTRSGKELIVTGNPVLDGQGNIVRIVINARDVSELAGLRSRLREAERLAEAYRRRVMQLENRKPGPVEMVARSGAMVRLLGMVDRVAGMDGNVLITGEPGTGKGVLASRIHGLSPRGKGPFVSINCGAIPENSLESELFGYAPGAGASKEGKEGLVRMAAGGTVFLDQVAELPLNLQVKLLHVIQRRQVTPVGGGAPQQVEVRFIAATHRDIGHMVREGLFHQDLYYQLNVIPLEVPPLRQRKEDIVPLAENCLATLCARYGMHRRLAPETGQLLEKYHWPGNVRELENIIERVAVTADGVEIKPVHLPAYLLEQLAQQRNRIYVPDLYTLEEAVQEVERQLLARAYRRYGSTYRMAEALGVNQSTVVRKMKKYMPGVHRRPGPHPSPE